MSESKPEYATPDKPRDHPARIDDATHVQIGELVTLFAGLPGVTFKRVMAAAVYVLWLYIKTWKAEGQDIERIWRDVSGGKG